MEGFEETFSVKDGKALHPITCNYEYPPCGRVGE